MGISASGLISGINVDDLVTQLMNLERRPITVLETRQTDYELKIASVLDIRTRLSLLKADLEVLNNSEKFNIKTASVTKTSSGDELLTVSASTSAVAGSHSIKVNQLAAANKKASQGWVGKNTTAIASSSGSFKFKVGSGGAVTTVSVNSTMTLQDLRDAINSANGDVTASILNDGTGSNPYRLVLAANNTGSSNSITIIQNDTDLDFTNKKVEAGYAYTTNTYAGTFSSNEGNNYTGTTNKTFLVEITTGGTPASGSAVYKYSTDGGITWSTGVSVANDDTLQYIDGAGSSNSTNEGVQIKFTSGTLAVGDRFSVDVFNPEMQAAQDAVIVVDNSTITKISNTISDVIQGVTMNLLKADSSSTISLTVSSYTSTAKTNIESFVESYNNVIGFLDEQLSFDPENDEEAKPFLGDATILEIRRKLGDVISGTIPGLSTSDYTNLSQIGITSNYETGLLSINSSTLSSALSSDPDAVAKLFIGTGEASNNSITYVSKTTKTQPGVYSISVSTAPEQATLSGDNDLSTTGLGSDETLIFKYAEDYTETDPTYTTFSVTLNSGSTINSIVNSLNSTFATNNVDLTASNNNGVLKITSTDYGADVWFQVNTDQGHATDQIWDTSATRSDAGVDIEGSINGHIAVGGGNMLTAASGFAEEGLKISTTSGQTGGFGTIRISSGIADKLPTTIDSYTNLSNGVLRTKENSLQKTIDDIEAQQEIMEERISRKEEILRNQFVRLEILLAKYDAQSQFLTNQLASLPNIIGSE